VVDKTEECEHFGGENVIIAGLNFIQSRNEREPFIFSRHWRESFRRLEDLDSGEKLARRVGTPRRFGHGLKPA
jgi:hypothetical protein